LRKDFGIEEETRIVLDVLEAGLILPNNKSSMVSQKKMAPVDSKVVA